MPRRPPPVRLVLLRPSNPRNLGAVARAMKTMGLADWAVVELGTHDFAAARRVAVHAEELLDRPRVARTLDEAGADCACVVGTSSRRVRGRRALSPGEVAREALARAARGLTRSAGRRRKHRLGPENHHRWSPSRGVQGHRLGSGEGPLHEGREPPEAVRWDLLRPDGDGELLRPLLREVRRAADDVLDVLGGEHRREDPELRRVEPAVLEGGLEEQEGADEPHRVNPAPRRVLGEVELADEVVEGGPAAELGVGLLAVEDVEAAEEEDEALAGGTGAGAGAIRNGVTVLTM